jgi:hypothetical protein
MPKRAAYVDSCSSIPTDLAAEMLSWEEFVTGREYSVTLHTSMRMSAHRWKRTKAGRLYW